MNNGFGSRLKSARIKRNMTIQELAEMSNIAKSTISQYENNETIDPRMNYVIKLAEVLDVPITYLTGNPLGKKEKEDYVSEVLNDYPDLKIAFHDVGKLSDEEIKNLRNDIELMLKMIVKRHKLEE